MPKMPDANDFGARQFSAPQTQVYAPDAGEAAAKGVQAFGQGANNAVDTVLKVEKHQEAKDAAVKAAQDKQAGELQVAQQNSNWLIANEEAKFKINNDQTIPNQDKPAAYLAATHEITAQTSAGITVPFYQQKFVADRGNHIAVGLNDTHQFAISQSKDAAKADVYNTGTQLVDIAGHNPDQAASLIDAHEQKTAGYVQAGYMSQEEKAKSDGDFRGNIAMAVGQAKPQAIIGHPDFQPVSKGSGADAYSQIQNAVFQVEGGLVKNDGHTGNPANFGINQKFNGPAQWAKQLGKDSPEYAALMRSIAPALDETGNLDVTKLTPALAGNIYKTVYWNGIHGDKLPANIAALGMNIAVNSGVGTANKMIADSGGDYSKLKDLMAQNYTRLGNNPDNRGSVASWASRQSVFNALGDSLTTYGTQKGATQSGAQSAAPLSYTDLTGVPPERRGAILAAAKAAQTQQQKEAYDSTISNYVQQIFPNGTYSPQAITRLTQDNIMKGSTGERSGSDTEKVAKFLGSIETQQGKQDTAVHKDVIDSVDKKFYAGNLTHGDVDDLLQGGHIDGKEAIHYSTGIDDQIEKQDKTAKKALIDNLDKGIFEGKIGKDIVDDHWKKGWLSTKERNERNKNVDIYNKQQISTNILSGAQSDPSLIGTVPHREAAENDWKMTGNVQNIGAALTRYSGVAPPGLKQTVESGLQIGTPAQGASVLGQLAQISGDNPYGSHMLGEFDQKTKDMTYLFNTQIGAGQGAEQAFINARDAVNPTDPVHKQRLVDEKNMIAAERGTGTANANKTPFDLFGQSQYQNWFNMLPGNGNTVSKTQSPANENYNQTQRDSLSADWNALFHAQYAATGSKQAAIDFSNKAISMRYAPSVANGGYLMKDAPEAVYGVSGADVKNYITAKGVTPDEQLFLIHDKAGNLTYMVRDKDGNPLFDPHTGITKTFTFDKAELQQPARTIAEQYGVAPVPEKRDPSAPLFTNAKIGM